MFFDWIKVEQDFPGWEMPVIASRGRRDIDFDTGVESLPNQYPVKHEGSYSTSVKIKISGTKLEFDGNISRWGRSDNLFGYDSLDDCMAAVNRLLKTIHPDLPQFTKFPKIKISSAADLSRALGSMHHQSSSSDRASLITQGAIFKELHITENKSVGQGCTIDYLKALSTQRYRNSIPRLHTNGRTVDWLSPKGNGGLLYPSVYDKAFELELRTLPKVASRYGTESAEYKYINDVISYCKANGVVRFEQKLKSRFLARNNLSHWGLFDDRQISSSFGPTIPALQKLNRQFIDLDSRLQVEAMSLENISEQLISAGVVSGTRSANTTSMYAMQWMMGQTFDLSKSQVKTHRARLRKIGIDIANPCDISRFSPVKVVSSKRIEAQSLSRPDWYKMPSTSHLRAVA